MQKRHALRAMLLAGCSCFAAPVWAQTASTPPADTTDQTVSEIVVTGMTSRNRPLITASADITLATRADIERKAPRSTADLLEMVPGIFVEGTAGELSNNYSVRGLQGGGQRFIQLQEDGLPVIYQGGGADFFFSEDITIDRMEAVKGGTSGILTVNGAGATINFLSRKPNFDKPEGMLRATGYNYGLKRGDFYYSAPIAKNLAFNVGGYVQSSPACARTPSTMKATA
jgi:iron complex outermembrane receptor protein